MAAVQTGSCQSTSSEVWHTRPHKPSHVSSLFLQTSFFLPHQGPTSWNFISLFFQFRGELWKYIRRPYITIGLIAYCDIYWVIFKKKRPSRTNFHHHNQSNSSENLFSWIWGGWQVWVDCSDTLPDNFWNSGLLPHNLHTPLLMFEISTVFII